MRDLYTVGFQFARKLEPKRDPNAAGEYARHMCVLWAFLLLVLFLEILTAALNMPIGALIGRNRIVHVAGAAVLLFVGNVVVKRLVGRIPELRTAIEIERHHKTLSQHRKVFVVTAALGTLVAVLGIVAARQFWGLFGGL